MSACSTFTEHVWKPGECKNCFKPKSLHQLPADPEPGPGAHGGVKTNANHSNNHRVRAAGSFRPPVAKKPTIAVKPTMMVADGPSTGGEPGTPESGESKPVAPGWNRNRAAAGSKPLTTTNNNNGEPEALSLAPKLYEPAKKGPGNNNNNEDHGLADVLKEVAGLGLDGEASARESFLGRINDRYRRSLERALPPSCLLGGRFCYPEPSSGEESDEDARPGRPEEADESWGESDEELLAMEIRMRGQPRFANFRAHTLSPVRLCVGKKWNTVPLRHKSLQRVCAVDYDDSYDEILNGYEDSSGASSGQGSVQSMGSSSSTSPESSLTGESRPETASSASPRLCNGEPVPERPGPGRDGTEAEPGPAGPAGQEKDASRASKGSAKAPETHKAVLALRLEEKDGKIAVQTDKQESKVSKEIAGQAVTISLVPVEEQAKPYRVVNLEQPLCKPYTVVDVSAAMAGERLDGPAGSARAAGPASTPSSPVTSPTLTPGPVSARFPKSSAIRYQEVWTSSTSPRQKIPKAGLAPGGPGPDAPPRKSCHKSAPTSPTATNVASKTIPVKSPNLSEIKFNSYNNAGMPPFPIIIHDEPSYARSSKNAIKVPIVINPSAYDNLAVYRSFLGTSAELSVKEKTTSVISHTYEEIETGSKASEAAAGRAADGAQEKGASGGAGRPRGAVAQKVLEFNSCLSRGQSSPQRSYSSSHSSPAKIPRPPPELAAKTEAAPECQPAAAREQASAAPSPTAAAVQPPQGPPEAAPPGPKTCSAEELYAVPPDAEPAPARPKSLFTPPPGGEAEAPPAADSPPARAQKEPLAKPAASPRAALRASPPGAPSPPFPPPRSTSSPYHAGSLLQRHFTNWTRPSGPARATEAEAVLHPESSRRAADAKPKRWISFKSFFRRRKTDEEDDREKEREKGKLVGLDGTVIHMLPPPPVQRHHWFTEARGQASEKPAIVFMYRCDPAQGQLSGDQAATAARGRAEEVEAGGPEKKNVHSPPQIPGTGPSHVTQEVPEGFSPQDPRTVSRKQNGTSVTPAPPAPDLEREEEKDDTSDPMDPNPCSATYSNLGQSRAAMIPPKHPRQPKGASDDAITFGEKAEQEVLSASQATPPPLPKKMIIRANTEPLSRDLQRAMESSLCVVANPTYDIDPSWDVSSAGSSLSCDLKGGDGGSCNSLERPVPSTANSICSFTALSAKDRFSNSTESLSSRRGPSCRPAQNIQKPQRQALYRGLENRDEVVGKIRSLHTDALKKLAMKCEDLFMAGQKDQLQFGVDSWSDFRLTSDKPCCEAGDAVYYTASYAKDPLNTYAVKICRSKAKESQQYYHSLAVRQSLAVHFNIQQDCGHFLAEVPARLLPWEDPAEPADPAARGRSHVVVITREVPQLTVADFVRDSLGRHGACPDAYERQVCLLLLQLCAGLEHLKPHHVTHCDLRLENLLLVPAGPAAPGPARLLVSNFSQAKQKSHALDPEALRDQARLAPEVLPGTQYRKCDEFQTGILVYEMLHLPNPFAQHPALRARDYTPAPRAALLQNWLDVKRTLLMIKFAEKSVEPGGAVGLEDWLCAQYLAFATADSLGGIAKILQQP
ncbi:PREDICTED: pseudopodium-enriched atypical kinase 1 [Dipodomys ordii]|uniref:Pseudopodium-enriched atypical kinase 1 n=1 Tax=Dipodomys ordii TaxID=10020 RepID=A0A1S3EVE0_DIPOR|nr:PREDICTED: pseudopodium-enriched atypical kinase 1 [Dipodomys ordii]